MALTLSIDPGYRNMGYCLVNNDTLEIVVWGVADFLNIKKGVKPTTHELANNCGKFALELLNKIGTELCTKITHIIIEDFKEGVNRIICPALCGCFSLLDKCNNVTVLSVFPLTVRNRFTKYGKTSTYYGNRKALKEKIVSVCNLLYPTSEYTFTNDHIADAYLQALYCIIYKASDNKTRKQWTTILDKRHELRTQLITGQAVIPSQLIKRINLVEGE